MAKYKVWDSQLNRHSFGGEIFNTKKDAIDQLISFFSADCWGDLTKIRNCLWESNEFADLQIIKETDELWQ